MSAHASDFAFQLPRLSYVDAKWEEPELRAAAATHAPAQRSWLTERIGALVAWYRRDRQAAELAVMSDRELMDMGITRSDLTRLFDPTLSSDLRRRGA